MKRHGCHETAPPQLELAAIYSFLVGHPRFVGAKQVCMLGTGFSGLNGPHLAMSFLCKLANTTRPTYTSKRTFDRRISSLVLQIDKPFEGDLGRYSEIQDTVWFAVTVQVT